MPCSLTSAVAALCYFLLGSVAFVTAEAQLECRPDCCPTGQFCCGTFCEAGGARPHESCIDVPNGCCQNRSNICAALRLLPPVSQPQDTASADPIGTDGNFKGTSADRRGFAVDTGSAPPPAAALQLETGTASNSPCRPDCCINGTFCCGGICREDRLSAALTCPASSTCCSDPLSPCFRPESTITAAPLDTPLPSPSPLPLPGASTAFPAAEPSASTMSPTALADNPTPTPPVSPPPLPTSAPPPAQAAPPTAPKICPDGCEPWWGRCAGHSYDGPGCCTAGSSCLFKNAGYSNCVPDELDPVCEVSGGPSGTAGRYCQCAGSQYVGPRTCSAGLECVVVNPFFAHCRPVCEASFRSVRMPAPASLLS